MKTLPPVFLLFAALVLFAFPADLSGQTKIPGDMAMPEADLLNRPQAAPVITNPPLLSLSNADVSDLFNQVDQALVMKYLNDLVNFGPRVTNSAACKAAGEYIFDEFDSMGLDVKYHNWSSYGYSGVNVEATIHDSSGTNDDIYIVCAHYDSVPGSPGADDNGSGTAAVMAIADVFRNYSWNCNLRFVAFSGEEQGLLGSEVYAKDAKKKGDKIVGVLNADMIGYAVTSSHESKLKVYNDTQSKWLATYADNIAQKYYAQLNLDVLPSGYSYGSDHTSFNQAGFSAVFYHEYKFNDYYHSPQDVISKMNLPYYTRCCQLISATMAEISGNYEQIPLTVDDYTLSAKDGGVCNFALHGGMANANRYYGIFAGITGTSPGFALPGGFVTMPINWDNFTVMVLLNLNSPLFANFYGQMDADGNASAKIDTYGPFNASSVGMGLSFAFTCAYPFDYVSNPVTITVID